MEGASQQPYMTSAYCLELTSARDEQRDNLPAKIRTYSVIATHKLTGFCEIIPGDTLLHYSHQDIGEFINGYLENPPLPLVFPPNFLLLKEMILFRSPERLENLMKSVAAACVTTAAFMITDRCSTKLLSLT